MKLTLRLKEGIPQDFGMYLFLLKDGRVKEGNYKKFPMPNHNYDIQISDLKSCSFHFINKSEVYGWFE